MNDVGLFERPDVAPHQQVKQVSAPKLPKVSVAGYEDAPPCCPWCKAEMSEARVSVEAIHIAYHERLLTGENPACVARNVADEAALVVDCPQCHRPSALVMRAALLVSDTLDEGEKLDTYDDDVVEGGFTELLPVRTPKDAEFLAGRLP